MTSQSKASENRRRQRRVTVRLSDDEYQDLKASAANAGLSIGGYLRRRALGVEGPRSIKRPRPGRMALGTLTVELQRLSAAHNKIGSNINQLARKANTDGIDRLSKDEISRMSAQYDSAVEMLGQMRAAVLKKLGYQT